MVFVPNMLVLVKNSNLPQLKWRTARIIKTRPGEDDVRVATLKTPNVELDCFKDISIATNLKVYLAEMKERGKGEIPEKTHRPAASSGTIPTCKNPCEPAHLDEGEVRQVCSSTEMQWWRKWEIPENTSRSTIPTSKNPKEVPLGNEPGSSWWEASTLRCANQCHMTCFVASYIQYVTHHKGSWEPASSTANADDSMGQGGVLLACLAAASTSNLGPLK
ncbi:hypothetical protein PR048_016123 [Dryococelus australis]|uniref:DUF5641 domain-containing protein n=1 Tax=Dryococelus australis TaxID=614101 RepID=A0ABQ9HIV5_9NEOP|nr:hypothetical protein PR048_016123 [Dryococelus australis]